MARDTSWLRRELTKALGWDEVVVNGVVEVITTSQTAEDIQDIVEASKCYSLLSVSLLRHSDALLLLQNFMNNDPTAIAIISEYMEARNKSKQVPNVQQISPPVASSSAPTTPLPSTSQRGSYAGSLAHAPAAEAQADKGKQRKQQQDHKQQQDRWVVYDKATGKQHEPSSSSVSVCSCMCTTQRHSNT
jgi:hypothetical protein